MWVPFTRRLPVFAALEAALQQEGECRLLSSGARKGLLPGGTQTAAKTQGKEQCLDPSLGLFSVREVEEGKGKSAAKVPFVTITRTGIEQLLAHRPPEDRKQLLDRCANPNKEAAHEAMLHVNDADLQQIRTQREQLDKRARELRHFVNALVTDQMADLKRTREELDRQEADLKSFTVQLTEPQTSQAEISSHTSERPRLAPPRKDGDIDFQRDLCRELVFAWQDSPEPEARAALERVMMNSGLEQVGEVGEEVAFDNREHRTDSDLLPGQPAVVVEPGWQFVSPRGMLLIAQAQVTTVADRKGVGHASGP